MIPKIIEGSEAEEAGDTISPALMSTLGKKGGACPMGMGAMPGGVRDSLMMPPPSYGKRGPKESLAVVSRAPSIPTGITGIGQQRAAQNELMQQDHKMIIRLERRMARMSHEIHIMFYVLWVLVIGILLVAFPLWIADFPSKVYNFPNTHTTIFNSLICLATLNALWIAKAYQSWKEEFCNEAHAGRENKKAASHGARPKLLSQLAKRRLMKKVGMEKECRIKHLDAASDQRHRADAMQAKTPLLSDDEGDDEVEAFPAAKRAKRLNMDHVSIPFRDYVWISYFVLPNAMYLWITGCIRMMFRDWCFKWGFVKEVPVDKRKLAATLLMESFQVVQLHAVVDRDGKKVGIWNYPNYPMMTNSNDIEMCYLIRFEVDLEAKSLIKAELTYNERCAPEDFIPLSPNDAIVLIWFHTIFAGHVKIHAFANWGINVTKQVDPFTQRMGIVTTAYNNFGASVFRHLCKFWFNVGWANYDLSGMVKVVAAGLNNHLFYHGNLRSIEKHSSIVHFILKLRNVFLNLFTEYREKKEFSGMDGEAFFVGTVIHSLDHTIMKWNMVDHLWLQHDNPKFAAMMEIGRFVRAGFVDDLPFLLFNKRYNNSPHPFYQEVYEKAKIINKKFADNMDCCIVK